MSEDYADPVLLAPLLLAPPLLTPMPPSLTLSQQPYLLALLLALMPQLVMQPLPLLPLPFALLLPSLDPACKKPCGLDQTQETVCA